MFDAAHLRACLLAGPQEMGVSEAGADDLAELTAAAVLVPIVRHALPTVLLTQRTGHLRDHAGQISFPGGRVDRGDKSPLATALREAEEEIGLDPRLVNILGYLPEYRTVTGFRITPVVGEIAPPLVLKGDPFEVSEIFEVPLAFLLDPKNHERRSLYYRGQFRDYLAMPYGDRFIWGATAGMLRELYERVSAYPSSALTRS